MRTDRRLTVEYKQTMRRQIVHSIKTNKTKISFCNGSTQSRIDLRKSILKSEILEHLESLGIDFQSIHAPSTQSKDVIRRIQSQHRIEVALREVEVLQKHGRRLIEYFAEGWEVVPSDIDPVIEQVQSDTEAALLFRFATLIWSVPVSRGFGRRMRFLVRDRSNGKLIGLMALGSPVFNLSARDAWIGWNVRDREQRLVNVMDAYVLGAVPPYARLLGGKLVGALVGSAEVAQIFSQRYSERRSILSKEKKKAKLVLVTTTSALGRSSIYNRLRLEGIIRYQHLGWTKGWGHFHIPDSIFNKMRELLEKENHKYASGHSFGDGPNWRMRVIRVALARLGLDERMLRHGIKREVYGIPLVEGWRSFLCGEREDVKVNRPPAIHIAEAAKQRWILARALRCPDYRMWTRDDTLSLITAILKKPIKLQYDASFEKPNDSIWVDLQSTCDTTSSV